jgi:hypothetical protein
MRRRSNKRIARAMRKLADMCHLGNFQRAYILGGGAGRYLVIGFFCLLIGLSLLAAFYLWYDSIFFWWPFWQMALIPGLGLCWFLISCWLLISALFVRRQRTYIFIKGLIYHWRGLPRVLRWNQIERIEQRDPVRHNPTIFAFYFDEGTSLILPADLPGTRALYHFLEDLLKLRAEADYMDQQPTLPIETPLLFPQQDRQPTKDSPQPPSTATPPHAVIPCPSAVEFEQGYTLAFGALKISKRGIEFPGRSGLLPWQEIAGIGIGKNALIIRRYPSEWHAIPLWTLSDISALKDLIAYIVSKE